jgi:hypothetical protein
MALQVIRGKQVLKHALQFLKIDEIATYFLKREITSVFQSRHRVHETPPTGIT